MAEKVVNDEIKDVETRNASEMLLSDFVKFFKEAEERQDLALISKPNSMKRKADEKSEGVKILEQALGILEQKRK